MRVVQKIGEALRENFQGLMFQVKVSQYGQHDQHLLQRLKLLDRIYNHVKVILALLLFPENQSFFGSLTAFGW